MNSTVSVTSILSSPWAAAPLLPVALLWVSGTQDNTGTTHTLQNDGDLVLRSAGGSVSWCSWTGGH